MSGIVTIGLFVTACSCSKSTPDTTPATPTVPGVTTTTKPKPTVIAPLTGAPTTNLAAAKRPALVVKIDNADPAARPQLGINQADVVYEERVEGNVTRLAAVFQSADADPVGPVRSARMTDIPILSALSRPLFAWSGANAGVTAAVRAAPIVDVGFDRVPGAYERRGVGGKVAPHNLYASTTKLFAAAPKDAKPPKPIFTFRDDGDGRGAGAREVREVHIAFGAPVDWRWDAKRNGFARWQRGTPHLDEAGVQVAPRNVIVQIVGYHANGDVDSTGGTVYEADQVGSGEAWLLTGGYLVEGSWSKPSPDAITTFTDRNHRPWRLNPGRTWVELAPPGTATVVR